MLRFYTSVKFYKGLLDQLNHITYIYDPNWKAGSTSKPTFPVCFFHVKSMQEVMTSEVSQKPLLFYNSNIDSENKVDNSAVINVVADNIVIKPKTYKLDVIIPYQDLDLLNQTFIYNTSTLQSISQTVLKTNGTTAGLASISTLTQPFTKLIRDLLKALLVSNFEGNAGMFMENILNQPDYNKNSLEAMWMNRRILKMKLWNSWIYKYVSIVDVSITKEGTEDGVYEATMTVQEMPIVTVKPKDKNHSYIFKNRMVQFQGNKAIQILDSAEVTFGKLKKEK